MPTIRELAYKYNHSDDFATHISKWFNEKDKDRQDDYYQEHILDTVRNGFSAKLGENFDAIRNKTDLMILTVGTSFAPIVLSISYIKPKNVLLLYSKDTENSKGTKEKADRIVNYIVSKGIIPAAAIDKRTIEETNAVNIYQTINEFYLSFGKPKNIVVDPTGGTKVMSAAVSMTGNILNAQTVYVGHKDSIVNNIPFPGSEHLEKIADPLKVLGGAKYDKAMQLMQEYDYGSALKILEELKNNTISPEDQRKYELVYKLLCVYSYWENMNFKEAKDNLEELLAKVKQNSVANANVILWKNYDFLSRQKEVLTFLAFNYNENQNVIYDKLKINNNKLAENLLFTLYADIKRRKHEEKYDLAVITMYRLIEFIAQRRLALKEIKAEFPSYNHLYQAGIHKKFDSEEKFIEAVKEVTEKIGLTYPPRVKFQRFSNGKVEKPEKLTMMNAYIILKTLNDEIFPEDNEMFDKNIFDLTNIRDKANIRNDDYLIHGYKIMDEAGCNEFEGFMEVFLTRFCKIENIDFKETLKTHTFLTPDDFN